MENNDSMRYDVNVEQIVHENIELKDKVNMLACQLTELKNSLAYERKKSDNFFKFAKRLIDGENVIIVLSEALKISEGLASDLVTYIGYSRNLDMRDVDKFISKYVYDIENSDANAIDLIESLDNDKMLNLVLAVCCANGFRSDCVDKLMIIKHLSHV